MKKQPYYILRMFYSRFHRYLAVIVTALALLPAMLHAQSGTGTITGFVSNKGTGEFLRNAEISVLGTSISTVAGAGGRFVLSSVPAGQAKLVAKYTGLDVAEVTVTVPAGQEVSQDIVMSNGEYDEMIILNQFVVSSEKTGNAKVIQEQRKAENMKTLVATDTFGVVSEGNVGEFLKYMPGVALDYVEADARQVRIRGMDPKYAVVMMDGMPIASAGSSNIGTGRGFEFEQLSISSIETIEMTKTPTPSDNASAVAGVINLRSKGAFDRKGRQIQVNASVAANQYYSELEKTPGVGNNKTFKYMPNFSAEYSDVFLGGRMGLIVGALYSYTVTAQKHFRVGGSGNGVYTWDASPDNNETETPRATAYNMRDGPKETLRYNTNIRLDYRISDNWWAWARADYNLYDATFINRDMTITMTTLDATATANPTTYTTIPTGGSISLFNSGSNNKFGDTGTLSAALNYQGGALSVDNQIQYSRATNHYDDLESGFFSTASNNLTGIGFTVTRPSYHSPEITVTQIGAAAANDWRNPNNYTPGTSFNSTPRDSKDQKWAAKSDWRYKLEGKIPTIFKAGYSYNEMYRDVDRESNTYTYVGPTPQPDAREQQFLMQFDMGGNIDGLRGPDVFRYADLLRDHPEYFSTNPVTNLQQKLFSASGNSEFSEKISAGYFQALFNFGRFDIAPGVRYENTDGSGIGRNDIGDAAARRALGLPTTGGNTSTFEYVIARYGKRRTAGNQYDNWFKYLHTNFRFMDNLILRGSYHDAITRADIGNLIPGVTAINENTQLVTTANPDLKPELSRNLNVALEYYFKGSGMISATVFRSDIKDLQRTSDTPLGADGLNGDTSYAFWTARETTNLAKSHRAGVELNYSQDLTMLPKPFTGLGIFANYTKLRFDNPINYFGSADTLANGGISYRYRKFNGSFRANWTDSKLLSTGSFAVGGAFVPPSNGIYNYEKERTMCDLELNYKLMPNATLTLTGRNVFNEPQYWYQNKEQFVTRVAYFGSLWTLGVRTTF